MINKRTFANRLVRDGHDRVPTCVLGNANANPSRAPQNSARESRKLLAASSNTKTLACTKINTSSHRTRMQRFTSN